MAGWLNGCQYPYLYRLLRGDEYPLELGITAKIPSATVSVYDHVYSGSSYDYVGSQYISTSASLAAITEFASHTTKCLPVRIAVINVEALMATGADVSFLDLTIEVNRAKFLTPPVLIPPVLIPPVLNPDKANNFANKFQEVLITGNIPKSCIVSPLLF